MSEDNTIVIEESVKTLENQIYVNSLIQSQSNYTDVFDTKGNSEVSTIEYLKRIFVSTEIEINTFKFALELLNKFCLKKKFFLLKKNYLKLLLTCCVVALKIHEDCIFLDKDYALYGGIRIASFLKLEYELLESLDYQVAFI